MITTTSFLFSNVQQPNNYIYQSNQHQSTKRPLLYIYLHAVSSLSIWWRTTRRTNQHFYCTNHNPHTTIHPSTMLFLFVLLSLARLFAPILSFCSIPFTPHSFFFDKEPSNTYIYFMLCLFCCLFNGNCKPISHNITFTWYDDWTL